ncbi:hypothetical protein P167DRAFT_285969 [Morchella conica CCBAS932]|uniref:Uncharacterized protein n=1 Tax=Morchella conica CCBAS932 TaxID=1392247 RepID=A0A3N4KN61_9PEZI|nr:hypothetical protein P167DRAFT_285969 [Morchella conica CCBAS932]
MEGFFLFPFYFQGRRVRFFDIDPSGLSLLLMLAVWSSYGIESPETHRDPSIEMNSGGVESREGAKGLVSQSIQWGQCDCCCT